MPGARDDRADGRAACRQHVDGGADPAQGQGAGPDPGHSIAAGIEGQIVRGDRDAQRYRAGGAAEHRIVERGIIPVLESRAVEPERGRGVPAARATAAWGDAVGAPLQVSRIGADAPRDS